MLKMLHSESVLCVQELEVYTGPSAGEWEMIFPSGGQLRQMRRNISKGSGRQKRNEFSNGRPRINKSEDI